MLMAFVLLLLPQWLELNTLQKDTIYKDILLQQGENPVFLFDKFFKVWDLPYLKILSKKILHLFVQMEDELVRTPLIYHVLQRLQVGIARIFILTILVFSLSGVF